ncbi:MAG: hypothetical protein EOM85_03630 [Candidatus Moranbacteria bacterium]|nr:hypothetical protein [Candidatus Moranbacteria bacterium]
MRNVIFVKSSKAFIGFDVKEFENSLYDCPQKFVKGFAVIDGKAVPAVAEVYPSCYANGASFVRTLHLDGLTIRFSEAGNAFAGPLWLFETDGVDYRS